MANNRIKILVIDDIQDNLITLNAMIKDAFPEAIALNAATGKTGLELAAKEEPDVVLLDILMPGMDGYEVCEKLKADELLCEIPVVFVSAAKHTKESRIRALECGGEAFLTKPIDNVEFTAQIRSMLKIRKANLQKRDEKDHLTELVNQKTQELDRNYISTLNLLEDLKRENESRIISEERFKVVTESAGNWIWEVDDKGMYTYSNPMIEKILGYTPEEIVGKKYFYDFLQENIKGQLKKRAFSVFKQKLPLKDFENLNVHKNGQIVILNTTASPVINKEGRLVGYRGADSDITETRQREKTRSAQLRLVEFSSGHTVMELLQKFLDEAELLTNSEVGFFHFVDDDQESLALQAWSTNTLKKMCSIEGVERHYPISQAGVWVDCIHQRKPVIHNDYESLLHKKGLPIGHSPIARELVVPVIRNEKIMAVLGVGNKQSNYDANDVNTIQQLADFAWEIVVRKKAEETLKNSEANFRGIFEQSPTAIEIYDKDGKLIDINQQTLDMFGLTDRKYILGFDLWSNPNLSNEKIERLKNGEEIYISTEFDFEIVKKNNLYPTKRSGKIHIDMYATPLMVKNDITGYLLQSIDVTESKQIHQTLKERNVYIESVMGNMPIGFAVNTINDGDVKYMNRLFSDIYGWPQEVLSNSNVFFEKVFPDKEYREKMQSKIIADMESGDPKRMNWKDLKIVTNTGELRYVHAFNIPLIGQNIMISTAQDTTKRKLAEDELITHRDHLEEMVKERTTELEEKNHELKRMNKLFVGRELRMIELKEKIKTLENEK